MRFPKLTAYASAALVAVSALFMSSCDDTTTTPSVFIPSAPSGLQVMSLSETSIRIAFTASASESNSSFKDYLLTVTNGTSSSSNPLAKGAAYYDITGLSAGKIYTLSLKARSTDSASSAITLDWATAKRFTGIRAYDKTSSLGSGIDLINGMNQTVAAGDKWDLCYDSEQGGFGSPSASNYVKGGQIGGKTPKTTYIFAKGDGTAYTLTADSLNAIWESKAINDTTSSRKLKVEGLVGVTGGVKSFVMYILTGDNHFAKVLVKANDGTLIQHDANGDYVEVDASVQQTALLPYALKRNFVEINDAGIKATSFLKVHNN